jgi:hypothetical protein
VDVKAPGLPPEGPYMYNMYTAREDEGMQFGRHEVRMQRRTREEELVAKALGKLQEQLDSIRPREEEPGGEAQSADDRVSEQHEADMPGHGDKRYIGNGTHLLQRTARDQERLMTLEKERDEAERERLEALMHLESERAQRVEAEKLTTSAEELAIQAMNKRLEAESQRDHEQERRMQAEMLFEKQNREIESAKQARDNAERRRRLMLAELLVQPGPWRPCVLDQPEPWKPLPCVPTATDLCGPSSSSPRSEQMAATFTSSCLLLEDSSPTPDLDSSHCGRSGSPRCIYGGG